MKRLWFLVFLAVLLVLAACGGETGADDNLPDSDIGDPAAGRQIYNTGGASGTPCASCHSLDGSVLVGPSLQGVAERADERMSELSAEDYIRQSITEPAAYLVEGYSDTMPKTYDDQLSEEDIDNLVAFLMTQ